MGYVYIDFVSYDISINYDININKEEYYFTKCGKVNWFLGPKFRTVKLSKSMYNKFVRESRYDIDALKKIILDYDDFRQAKLEYNRFLRTLVK